MNLLKTAAGNASNSVIPKLKYPLIFSHGLFGFSSFLFLHYFNNIVQPIKRHTIAETTVVHPTDSIKNRAESMYSQIQEIMKRHNTDKVHIIAHSMGGLDARYLINKLDQGRNVLSLTTLSTPHRGSYIAEWSILNITQKLYIEHLFKTIGIPLEALDNLTPEFLNNDFNKTILDQPHVQYTSYGAYKDSIQNFFTPMRYFHKLLLEKEGKNDGLVSLNSSKWGESFKVIHNCDHRDLINLGFSGYNAFPIYENICKDIYDLEQQLSIKERTTNLPHSTFTLNNNFDNTFNNKQ
ncbi:hypothetical protein DICPUDRAFT_27048 [Dictyostelium purpureum]|uniref:GPI inositol-deacylase n=1 Tax=Dictyostelium purpureum TaxID=5786 RepID=F0Z9N8_DICPU|nr:uncharacterized protein DICPUDRAFT_27048 [Dictyostelium purpureum]EGC39332.1 hypothetical protein DICPUDRAFT_27048 [Dictyostelium purpureum]|eukprot:XP_003284120.1 hypothetical protein DICPUDRAFT_27048 [Dictyostelium purpureum]